MKIKTHPQHPHMICVDGPEPVILGQMHSLAIAQLMVTAVSSYQALMEGVTNLLNCAELNGETIAPETDELIRSLLAQLKRIK